MNKHRAGFGVNAFKALIPLLGVALMVISYQTASAQGQNRMVRLSEIEIDPVYLDEYKAILAEESAASVKLEPGVIAIFPMYQKENPISIRILEMYADKAAYEQHLKTPHFQTYKATTLKMVKSLKLVDMVPFTSAERRYVPVSCRFPPSGKRPLLPSKAYRPRATILCKRRGLNTMYPSVAIVRRGRS